MRSLIRKLVVLGLCGAPLLFAPGTWGQEQTWTINIKGADIHETRLRDVMHSKCKTTSADVLAAEALRILEENKITSLLVTDDDNKLVGALNIHDLFREGLM